MTILSLGVGVDSSAIAVMLATNDSRVSNLRRRLAVVVDSDLETELPPTYVFRDRYLVPFLEARGLSHVTVSPSVHDRHGQIHSSLYDYYYAQAIIPTRARRSCTDRFKIAVVQDFALTHLGDNQLTEVIIGFDCHETGRAAKLVDDKRFTYRFPLVEMGLDRLGASAVLFENGLPVPRRSACYICPFSRAQDWWELRKRWPMFYDAAKRLEENMQRERGRDDLCIGYKPLRVRHDPKPFKISAEAIKLFNLAQSYLGRIEPAWPSHALCLAARDIYGLWWVDALRSLDLGRHTPDDPWQMYVRIEYSLELSGQLPIVDIRPCGAWEFAAPVMLPSAGNVGVVL